MKLTDLEPRWGGEDGKRYCLLFQCPVCSNGHGIKVNFAMFKGYDPEKDHIWQMTGDSFDTLTFSPSIDATKDKQGKPTGCKFHGYITNGEVTW